MYFFLYAWYTQHSLFEGKGGRAFNLLQRREERKGGKKERKEREERKVREGKEGKKKREEN